MLCMFSCVCGILPASYMCSKQWTDNGMRVMWLCCCAGAVTPWGASAGAAPPVGGVAEQEEADEEEAVPCSESAELRQLRLRHWGNISYR
jgi:hypothetical protein